MQSDIRVATPLLKPALVFDSDCAVFGGAAIALLQILMVLTGNHALFNWFTLAPCLLLWITMS